jgi:chemotaxis protein methyltransferase CheR
MSEGLSNLLLARFSEFVADRLGLYFPMERWSDLERGIRAAAREFGHEDAEACALSLMSGPLTKAQVGVLAGVLTVGETYFFREKRTFEALERRVLPELIRERRAGDRRIRLWSAGCCTGEEAYSLAILLRRLLPDPREWNVTILATDVNPRFLGKAAHGVFGEWSFRDAPVWLKDGYFTPAGAKQYAIRPEIKGMVTFEHLNLAQDAYPSLLNDTNAMDAILCRNVLMYFEPRRMRAVVGDLHRCLVEGGWLAMGATEVSPAIADELTPVHLEGAILYRKSARKPLPAPALMALSIPEPALEPAARPIGGQRADARTVRDLANEGRLAEALTCADEIVAAEKLNPRAHYLRALILLEQGASQDAAKALHRALYLDHEFVLAHFTLGNLARNAGRAREADKHFENALRRLRACRPEDILPESDGLTAGRLAEIIAATKAEEPVT